MGQRIINPDPSPELYRLVKKNLLWPKNYFIKNPNLKLELGRHIYVLV